MKYGSARKSNWRGIAIACAAGAVGTGVMALPQTFVAAAPKHLQNLAAAEHRSFAEVVDIVKPAVIGIRARVVDDDDAITILHGRRVDPTDVSRPPRFRTSQGAGFFITPDGYAVTNNHVIRGSSFAEILTDGGQVYRAKVVGVDPASDLALLKVDGRNDFPHVQFSETPPRIGDWIIAIGNPFGLGGTVTAGIVSARGRDLANEKDLLQIDAPVNRGNSGGPTFDLQGQVVGVNSMIISPTGASVGVAFAIPAATVRHVVEQLKDKGSVTRGWLDVQFQSVSPEVAAPLGLDSASGVLIAEVPPGGPGAAAGTRGRGYHPDHQWPGRGECPRLQSNGGGHRPGRIVAARRPPARHCDVHRRSGERGSRRGCPSAGPGTDRTRAGRVKPAATRTVSRPDRVAGSR